MGKIILIVTIAAGLFICGCETANKSYTRTETITTTTESPAQTTGNKGNFVEGRDISTGATVKKSEVVTTEEQKEEKKAGETRGVIGSTFHFVGQVLAFPFKVIAGVIEFIF